MEWNEIESKIHQISSGMVCLLFSGKRKSGKDYTVNQLVDRLQTKQLRCTIVRLSEPVKTYFAEAYSLDLEKLLSSSSYKEFYRKQMVEWVEKQILADPHKFSKEMLIRSLLPESDSLDCHLPNVLIVSDARRLADIDYFSSVFRPKCCFIRIEAPIDIRINRGWCFIDDIDNAQTECGLDSYNNWDFVFCNDGNQERFECFLKQIMDRVEQLLL